MKKYNFIVTKPAGMTLIELLVVISILGLLTVIVIPALSGNRENNANRNAAQQVSGLISQSRNDAISAGRWAGFTVLENENGLNGLDIARCRVPPPYRGDLDASTLTFTQNPFGNRNITGPIAGLLSLTPDNIGNVNSPNRAGVQVDDFISFNGEPLRYRIVPFHSNSSPPYISQPSSSQLGFRIAPVGSPLTTPWPPAGVPMAFSIERQPRVVGSTIALSTESSIDMRWSGYGGLGSYTEFWGGTTGTVPPQVSVLFDDRGTLRELIVDGERRMVDGAVFFLIGRVDRRGQSDTTFNSADDTTGANWQYPTSYWVVIDPVSGQTRIAECVPGASTLEASQQYAREGLISQGL
ncbi:MAG: pilus assembly FimT family protein [Pirellulales bacterium]